MNPPRNLQLMMNAPSPSPLPDGERDGVRGNVVDCNEI